MSAIIPEKGLKLGTAGVLVWPALALVLLLVFNFFFVDGFFQISYREGQLYGSLIDVFNNATPVALMALGMTLVIATGGIDLSVGTVAAIAGATAASLMADGTPQILAIGIALAVALACGLINGGLVSFAGVQPIIATLILMVAGRGVAQMIGQQVPVDQDKTLFLFIGGGSFAWLPFTVTVTAIAAIVLIVLTRVTALGLFIESVGNNPLASRFAGLRINFIRLFVYAVCGLTAGLAGLVYASDIRMADSINAGLYKELDAILAVVVGGTALAGGRYTLVGAVLGAVLIQTLETTILSTDTAKEVALVVKAIVVLAVCLLQAPDFRRRLVQRFKIRSLSQTTGEPVGGEA